MFAKEWIVAAGMGAVIVTQTTEPIARLLLPSEHRAQYPPMLAPFEQEPGDEPHTPEVEARTAIDEGATVIERPILSQATLPGEEYFLPPQTQCTQWASPPMPWIGGDEELAFAQLADDYHLEPQRMQQPVWNTDVVAYAEELDFSQPTVFDDC